MAKKLEPYHRFAQEFLVALCLGTYCDPRGVGVSCERGTPVRGTSLPRQGRDKLYRGASPIKKRPAP